MLYAMKAINFPAQVYGKLPTAFPRSNTYYTIGGGYVSNWIQYYGYTSVTTLKPKTLNQVPDTSISAATSSISNITDPNLAVQPAGAQVGQLMVIERTEFYRYQHINAAGSGSDTPVYFNQYNWSNLTNVGKKDDATFNADTVQPFYYPLDGTVETPVVSWGALLCRFHVESVFITLDASDLDPQTVTPGTSAQITAKKAIPAPITEQQIFLM